MAESINSKGASVNNEVVSLAAEETGTLCYLYLSNPEASFAPAKLRTSATDPV